MKPITPSQALKAKAQAAHIPKEVFEVVNALLVKRINGHDPITMTQDEVVSGICLAMPDVGRNTIFNDGWLDFEHAYSEAGWKVRYDKPGYCENYNAFWEFTRG